MIHTFAICAYKESPFLEECIHSLQKQTVKSNIILITSTPNELISALCKKYNIPMYINTEEHGITQDWNFAYSLANTKYVTIAHQDDIYLPRYVEEFLKMVNKAKRPIIYFADYCELRDGKIIRSNTLLRTKRLMLLPLTITALWKSKFVRRRILSLGSPICCPSVTFIRENCPRVVFQHGFRASEDWQAWERLSRLRGSFVYNPRALVYHRIHEDSETSKVLDDSGREWEDYTMFKMFWPEPFAKLLSKLYRLSENSNYLD